MLMTAAAADLGVLPIAIGWGAGAELQQPMTIALIGELITSTILTLVALPALYGMSEGVHEKAAQWWSRWRNRRVQNRASRTSLRREINRN